MPRRKKKTDVPDEFETPKKRVKKTKVPDAPKKPTATYHMSKNGRYYKKTKKRAFKSSWSDCRAAMEAIKDESA